MNTYYLDLLFGGKNARRQVEARAESIDNLRRNLIRDYSAELKGTPGYIIVRTRRGPEYGASFEEIGTLVHHENSPALYDIVPTGYYWRYHHKMRRVSPKTGALLDVNREWRYL